MWVIIANNAGRTLGFVKTSTGNDSELTSDEAQGDGRLVGQARDVVPQRQQQRHQRRVLLPAPAACAPWAEVARRHGDGPDGGRLACSCCAGELRDDPVELAQLYCSDWLCWHRASRVEHSYRQMALMSTMRARWRAHCASRVPRPSGSWMTRLSSRGFQCTEL